MSSSIQVEVAVPSELADGKEVIRYVNQNTSLLLLLLFLLLLLLWLLLFVLLLRLLLFSFLFFPHTEKGLQYNWC